MKEYKKPAMMALSISANDQLCGSCDIGTRNNPEYSDLDAKFGNRDGLFDQTDVDSFGLFGSGEDCDFECTGYCKFTANDNQSLFTS